MSPQARCRGWIDIDSVVPVISKLAMDSIAFCCIVDRPAYLMAQTYVWVECLLDIQKIEARLSRDSARSVGKKDKASWTRQLLDFLRIGSPTSIQ